MDQKKQGQQSEPFKGQQKWQEHHTPHTPGGGPEKGGDLEQGDDLDRDTDGQDEQDELPERGQSDQSER